MQDLEDLEELGQSFIQGEQGELEDDVQVTGVSDETPTMDIDIPPENQEQFNEDEQSGVNEEVIETTSYGHEVRKPTHYETSFKGKTTIYQQW